MLFIFNLDSKIESLNHFYNTVLSQYIHIEIGVLHELPKKEPRLLRDDWDII